MRNTILKLRDLAAKLNDLAANIEPFRKMLHFGKIPKKMVKFGETSAKIWQNLRKFGKKQQQIQQFLTKILRLKSGAKECIL